MQVIASRPLGELLIDRGLLTPDQLEDALDRQLETGQLLGAILVEQGIVTAPALTALLAEQAGVVWKPLGELLVERGLLSAPELDDALAQQQLTGERLGSILVERRIVAGAVLAAILAEQAGSELEREAGFGTGLFAKLAGRGTPAEAATPRRGGSPSRGGMEPTDPASAAGDDEELDPAFELIRLRSELEGERARVAALERELAELRAATRKRRPSSR